MPNARDQAEIKAAILDVLARRRPGASICPSEVARVLAPVWRPLMPAIRTAAAAMAQSGSLAVTQKGRPVNADTAKGPIRLALPRPTDPDPANPSGQ